MAETDLSADDIRIIQAMTDFQMALSAIGFLSEADLDKPITRIERRRLRCFEDAAVVSYWRPFCQSNGLPTLSLKKLGIRPNPEQLALHYRLKDRRNKVIAHTDIDRMRLAFMTSTIWEDSDIKLPHYDFDDALEFGADQDALILWLRIVSQAAAGEVFNRMQRKPEIRIKRDHLDPRQSTFS